MKRVIVAITGELKESVANSYRELVRAAGDSLRTCGIELHSRSIRFDVVINGTANMDPADVEMTKKTLDEQVALFDKKGLVLKYNFTVEEPAPPPPPQASGDTALAILRARFAKGEITAEQLAEMRKVLEG